MLQISNQLQLIRNYLHFMEPGNPLSCSKKATTGPYPEPDESIPHPHTLFLYSTFYCFSPIDAYFSLVISFHQVFQVKICMHFSTPQYVLHTPHSPRPSLLQPTNITKRTAKIETAHKHNAWWKRIWKTRYLQVTYAYFHHESICRIAGKIWTSEFRNGFKAHGHCIRGQRGL